MTLSSAARLLEALRLLEQAIERDPRYGPALSYAALCCHRLLLGSEDPEVLAVAAFVIGIRGDDTDVAVSLVDRALALNPSFALGWYWSGVLRVAAGYPDLALEHFETFLRLSPRERPSSHLTGIGMALFMKRRFEEAAAKLVESLEQAPNFTISLRYLAACHAHLGRLDEARDVVARLRAITPVTMPTGTVSRDPEQRELLLSGLRLAASEES